ncbi:MAG: GFA family protein [Caulobacter sp.]|nr:GFA family protein [Caulobacter sp.]
MPRYAGACHCGTLRFEVEADPVETTSCDCSLCAMRNAVMIQVPQAALRLLAGEDLLATYVWNTGVARHHFCGRCGVYVFHRKRAAPDSFGVNVFCLRDFDPAPLPHRRTDGAGMSLLEARL